MEHKFTKHLIEIGFIDKKTASQILSLYREKCFLFNNLNRIKFNESMTEILLSILNNLTEIQKKFICFHLPAKFIKITHKKLQDKLRNIIDKKNIKNKLILSKYLFRWYKNINKSKKNYSIEKNIFRQKSNKTFLNSNNNSINKCYISHNIKNFLFNNDNDKNNQDNYILKHYQSNLNTLNNEPKNKTMKNSINQNHSNKNPKKTKCLYNKDILNVNDINFINNITNDRSITTTNNKKLLKNNNQNQIKKDNKTIFKKNSDNDTLLSGFRDSIESNENCLSTNLNTINNKYNNNQENKTLSHSEYISNLDIINNYNIKTYKKISNNSSSPKKNLKETMNYINQKKIIKKNKIKNKSNLIQNILNEDFDNNYSFSPTTKTKKINENNIFNLIYCNNYNNSNNNNYIYDDYNLFNYQTPFCETMKNSKSSKEYSVCNRLFEDGKKRKRMQNQKIKEQEKYFEEMSSGISGDKKSVDYNRINNLYKSKERSNTYEKTKNKVEQEEGLTFKPMVTKNEYSKRIYGNFMERNLSSKSKDNNVNDYNYTSNNINGRKKFTKKQKEKIVKGVINRLYSNSLVKSSSICCNKYTKGINQKTLKPYKKKL